MEIIRLGIDISIESITCEPANPPLLQNLCPHLLMKLYSIHVSVEHRPFHYTVPHPHCLLHHRRKQHFPEPLPPVALPHKQVLNVKPSFPQKGGVIWEKQHKPSNDGVPAVGPEQITFWVIDGEVQIEGFDGAWVGRVVALKVKVFHERRLRDLEDEDGEGLERMGGEEDGGEGGLGCAEEVG
ncbi:hypothetical protein PS2_040783 [Malus domestica]